MCQGGKATLEIKGLRRSGFVDDMVYEVNRHGRDDSCTGCSRPSRDACYRYSRVAWRYSFRASALACCLRIFILRLRMSGVLAVLSSACPGIVRINDVQTISATLNGQRVTRSVVDIDFAVGVEVRDCPPPYIDSVCFGVATAIQAARLW